jgi:hypothetical protein
VRTLFARLPQLVERAGNSDRGVGWITAFYTVLVEGDDQNDPIADAARAEFDKRRAADRREQREGDDAAMRVSLAGGGSAPMWLSMTFWVAVDCKTYRRATWRRGRHIGVVRAQ